MSVLLIIGVATAWASVIVLLVAICRNAASGDAVQVLPSADPSPRFSRDSRPCLAPRRSSHR